MRLTSMVGLLLREYERNVLLLVLLLVVPVVFITLSIHVTEDVPLSFVVRDNGGEVTVTEPMPDVHGAIMVPIAAAFLAGLVGLFTMLGSSRGDARLIVAGASPAVVTGVRIALIFLLSGLVTVVSIGVALIDFRPEVLWSFVAANVLVSVTYALLGVLAALIVGRLGGAYVMFTLPMIDIGIYQDPMLVSGTQSFWMKLLPGFGGTRLVLDAGFTDSFDEWTALAAALVWPVLLGLAVIYMFGATRAGVAEEM